MTKNSAGNVLAGRKFMSTTLLKFNPEAYGSGGDRLLFGVAVPQRPRPSALSALEELNLASLFLEAKFGPEMARLLNHIIRRGGVATGRGIDPSIADSLMRRLTMAAVTIRDALRPGSAGAGSPRSPEAIFGAELEGLSREDQELETARRFVRFAHEMTRTAMHVADGAAPDLVTSRAEDVAARRLAPGLSRAITAGPLNFRARRRARIGQ
jgi:hypothetical protein